MDSYRFNSSVWYQKGGMTLRNVYRYIFHVYKLDPSLVTFDPTFAFLGLDVPKALEKEKRSLYMYWPGKYHPVNKRFKYQDDLVKKRKLDKLLLIPLYSWRDVYINYRDDNPIVKEEELELNKRILEEDVYNLLHPPKEPEPPPKPKDWHKWRWEQIRKEKEEKRKQIEENIRELLKTPMVKLPSKLAIDYINSKDKKSLKRWIPVLEKLIIYPTEKIVVLNEPFAAAACLLMAMSENKREILKYFKDLLKNTYNQRLRSFNHYVKSLNIRDLAKKKFANPASYMSVIKEEKEEEKEEEKKEEKEEEKKEEKEKKPAAADYLKEKGYNYSTMEFIKYLEEKKVMLKEISEEELKNYYIDFLSNKISINLIKHNLGGVLVSEFLKETPAISSEIRKIIEKLASSGKASYKDIAKDVYKESIKKFKENLDNHIDNYIDFIKKSKDKLDNEQFLKGIYNNNINAIKLYIEEDLNLSSNIIDEIMKKSASELIEERKTIKKLIKEVHATFYSKSIIKKKSKGLNQSKLTEEEKKLRKHIKSQVFFNKKIRNLIYRIQKAVSYKDINRNKIIGSKSKVLDNYRELENIKGELALYPSSGNAISIIKEIEKEINEYNKLSIPIEEMKKRIKEKITKKKITRIKNQKRVETEKYIYLKIKEAKKKEQIINILKEIRYYGYLLDKNMNTIIKLFRKLIINLLLNDNSDLLEITNIINKFSIDATKFNFQPKFEMKKSSEQSTEPNPCNILKQNIINFYNSQDLELKKLEFIKNRINELIQKEAEKREISKLSFLKAVFDIIIRIYLYNQPEIEFKNILLDELMIDANPNINKKIDEIKNSINSNAEEASILLDDYFREIKGYYSSKASDPNFNLKNDSRLMAEINNFINKLDDISENEINVLFDKIIDFYYSLNDELYDKKIQNVVDIISILFKGLKKYKYNSRIPIEFLRSLGLSSITGKATEIAELIKEKPTVDVIKNTVKFHKELVNDYLAILRHYCIDKLNKLNEKILTDGNYENLIAEINNICSKPAIQPSDMEEIDNKINSFIKEYKDLWNKNFKFLNSPVSKLLSLIESKSPPLGGSAIPSRFRRIAALAAGSILLYLDQRNMILNFIPFLLNILNKNTATQEAVAKFLFQFTIPSNLKKYFTTKDNFNLSSFFMLNILRQARNLYFKFISRGVNINGSIDKIPVRFKGPLQERFKIEGVSDECKNFVFTISDRPAKQRTKLLEFNDKFENTPISSISYWANGVKFQISRSDFKNYYNEIYNKYQSIIEITKEKHYTLAFLNENYPELKSNTILYNADDQFSSTSAVIRGEIQENGKIEYLNKSRLKLYDGSEWKIYELGDLKGEQIKSNRFPNGIEYNAKCGINSRIAEVPHMQKPQLIYRNSKKVFFNIPYKLLVKLPASTLNKNEPVRGIFSDLGMRTKSTSSIISYDKSKINLNVEKTFYINYSKMGYADKNFNELEEEFGNWKVLNLYSKSLDANLSQTDRDKLRKLADFILYKTMCEKTNSIREKRKSILDKIKNGMATAKDVVLQAELKALRKQEKYFRRYCHTIKNKICDNFKYLESLNRRSNHAANKFQKHASKAISKNRKRETYGVRINKINHRNSQNKITKRTTYMARSVASQIFKLANENKCDVICFEDLRFSSLKGFAASQTIKYCKQLIDLSNIQFSKVNPSRTSSEYWADNIKMKDYPHKISKGYLIGKDFYENGGGNIVKITKNNKNEYYHRDASATIAIAKRYFAKQKGNSVAKAV
ncbi:MAG: hypothetical protein ACTSO2_18120 [Promethearchaeota archaeon]